MSIKKLVTKIKNNVKKLLIIIQFRLNELSQRTNQASAHENKGFVLFFLPEMSIKLYSQMMVSVAENVRDKGFKPLFFGCNGFLNGCILQDRLSIRSVLFRNSMACVRCYSDRAELALKSKVGYLDCKRSQTRTISFISTALDERLTYSYKGIPIGRLAYYDLSIKFKRDLNRRELNTREILYYDGAISDSVGIIDFLDQNRSTISLNSVVAIDEYSLSNVVREWARINSISAFRAGFSYHFNADPQFVTLSSTKTRASEKFDRAYNWRVWRNIPLPPPVIHEIASDLIFRMSGSGGHIFSSNYTGDLDGIMERFGFRPDVKTFVVFTSANDEIDAISELSKALGDQFEVHDAFDNQIAWLKAIVGYASQHDVQVIIKVHPRLSKSHRDFGAAEDIHTYQELAEKSPSNVIFLWPEESVSAYDILQLADCCLTAWGTMGLEAAKLGVPVVTGMTKITFVTPGLSLFSKATSKEQFYRLIGGMKGESHVNEIIETFRWQHLVHMSGAIITDRKRHFDLYGKDFGCDFADVLNGANVEDKKRELLSLRAAKNFTEALQEEHAAVMAALDRFINFFEDHSFSRSFDSKLVTRLRSTMLSIDNKSF